MMEWLLVAIVTNWTKLDGGFSVNTEKFRTQQECQVAAQAVRDVAEQGWGGKARTKCVELTQETAPTP